jgi:hypothetical protein
MKLTKDYNSRNGSTEFSNGQRLGIAQVGRVSPRPQDRGRSCTLLGREPLRVAKALGLNGAMVAMILRSRRDAPYLRNRQASTLY